MDETGAVDSLRMVLETGPGWTYQPTYSLGGSLGVVASADSVGGVFASESEGVSKP